jgi:hypothetical protein
MLNVHKNQDQFWHFVGQQRHNMPAWLTFRWYPVQISSETQVSWEFFLTPSTQMPRQYIRIGTSTSSIPVSMMLTGKLMHLWHGSDTSAT